MIHQSDINFDQFQQQDEITQKINNPEKLSSRKQLKDIIVASQTISIKDFADLIKVQPEKIIQTLSSLAIQKTEQDEISFEECELIGYEHDCKILQSKTDSSQYPLRAPVVTIMGHVDHGKTSLLDAFRNSNIADQEYGAITQKIGAFHVVNQEGKRITFIDTPGHEAFTNMRVRGASTTDMVILVVSAVDGIQPQTLEVIRIVKNAKVPVIVAINKIDIMGAVPEQIEQELFDEAGLNLETHGGNIPVIHISAKFRTNIDLLEELILFEAEMLDLREQEDCDAEGIVLESRRDSQGDSRACTLIVQKGTLNINDYVVIGTSYTKVKIMKDDRSQVLERSFPSYAVEISGLKELPESGDSFFVVKDEKKAKMIANRRKILRESQKEKYEEISGEQSKLKFENWREKRKFHSGNKEFVKEKYAQIEEKYIQQIESIKEQGASKQEIEKIEKELLAHRRFTELMLTPETPENQALNLILKSPDKGTQETLIAQIRKVAQQYPDVKIQLVQADIGSISENDVKLASLFKGIIFAMDVPTTLEAQKLQKLEMAFDQFKNRIIYGILEDIQNLIQDNMNDKKSIQNIQGAGKILNVFEIKLGKGITRKVAGVNISKGKFTKKLKYKLIRDKKVIKEELDLANLKKFKDEVNEIKKGEECGVCFVNFDAYEPGDIIESYEIQQITKKFNSTQNE